jgi:lytic murein transglycosylase
MFRIQAAKILTIIAFAVCLDAGAAFADSRFRVWVDELWPEVRAAGVSRATFDLAFEDMTPDCKLPGIFCPGEKRKPGGRKLSERTGLPASCNKVTQKEFLRPVNYFPAKYMRTLALRGRKILADLEAENPKTHEHLLQIERSFRVSRYMLMGLWGRETAFGQASMKHNALRALTSYAYSGYQSRRKWFRKQLIAALKMVDDGHIVPGNFTSSYAGATGLTQIMPDEFLGFAIDGDRDGKRDIWNSVPDSLATTANVLKDRGWHSGARSWGYEIDLPEPSARFDCTMENRSNRWPIGRWERDFGLKRVPRLGVKQPAFPDPDNIGYLVLPAGARGPAFLVTENFDVLRSYNTSDVYALFVGHLADRIGCDTANRECRFYQSWPKDTEDDFKFSVERLCRMQIALKEQGHLEGTPDGLFGAQTRVAIGNYQKAKRRKPDCYPTQSLYNEIVGRSPS